MQNTLMSLRRLQNFKKPRGTRLANGDCAADLSMQAWSFAANEEVLFLPLFESNPSFGREKCERRMQKQKPSGCV